MAIREKREGVILVVDDEQMVLDLVCSILRASGYRALPAASAEEALALARAKKEVIEVVLTDFMMDSMNGLELCKHITLECPGIQCVVMTGHINSFLISAEEFGFEANCQSLLEKPFSLDMLLRFIDSLFDFKESNSLRAS